MPRKLIVEIAADATAYIKGLRQASEATKIASQSVKELDLDTTALARVQVTAAVKSTEALQKQAVAYRQIASAAERGSGEQVAAAKLATDAERRLAASMGVVAAESSRMRGAVSGASKEIDRAVRGALSGSGVFKSFGRSLAFASGGYLAFRGVTEFFQESISIARDAAVSQRSLAAQLKTSGESFAASKDAIDKAGLSLEKFGYTSEDSEKALAVLDRATGNVAKAIQIQGVAANVARARNIPLAQAALILGKAYDGQTASLKRLGVEIPKGVSGMQAIYIVAQKYAGQGAANTTESLKFAATLHNTQLIIGTALLPTVNKYLGQLAVWLDKMNRSGRLQKDVNQAVKIATGLLSDLKGVVKAVDAVTGSFKNTLEILLALKVYSTLTKWTSGFVGLGRSAGEEGAAGEVETLSRKLTALQGLGIIGVEIVVAEKLKVVSGPFQAAQDAAKGRLSLGDIKNFLIGNIVGPPGHRGLIGNWLFPGRAKSSVDLMTQMLQGSQAIDRTAGKQGLGIGIPAGYTPLPAAAAAAAGRPGATVQQRNTWFDQMISRQLGRVQDIASIRGQITNLKTISKEISDRIAVTKDITRKLNLEDQLLSVRRQIRGLQATLAQNAQQAAQAAAARKAQAQQALFDRLQFNVDKTGLTDSLSDDLAALKKYEAVVENIIATQGSNLALQQKLLGVELNIKQVQDQITANRKAAADAAKAAAKQQAADAKAAAAAAKQQAQQAAQAAQAARDAVQFRLLGLGPTGGALVPGVSNLTKRLGQIKDAVKGTFLDTTKTGKELSRISKILSGQFGAVSESVRAAIDQMFNDIRDKLGQHASRPAFRRETGQQFVDSLGLNLTLAQRRRIEAGIAGMGPGGSVPQPSGQFTGGGVVITGPVHVHGVQNIADLENQITRRAKARAHTRRGA